MLALRGRCKIHGLTVNPAIKQIMSHVCLEPHADLFRI